MQTDGSGKIPNELSRWKSKQVEKMEKRWERIKSKMNRLAVELPAWSWRKNLKQQINFIKDKLKRLENKIIKILDPNERKRQIKLALNIAGTTLLELRDNLKFKSSQLRYTAKDIPQLCTKEVNCKEETSKVNCPTSCFTFECMNSNKRCLNLRKFSLQSRELKMLKISRIGRLACHKLNPDSQLCVKHNN